MRTFFPHGAYFAKEWQMNTTVVTQYISQAHKDYLHSVTKHKQLSPDCSSKHAHSWHHILWSSGTW
jgi:hypothetical protein